MASTPGGASQRLLTMKFMQRAAAANSSPTSPSTPASASDDGHPSKRQKIGGRSSLGGREATSYVVDQKAAQAALEEEDRKRQAAIDKMAERLGDSHWVLDTAKLPSSHKQAAMPLNIVQVGFSEIDRRGDTEEGQEKEEALAFQTYGPKKKAQKDKNNKESDLDSDSDSDSDSASDSESDSDDSDHSSDPGSSSEEADEVSKSKPGRASYGSQKRDEIRSRKKAEQEKSRKMASERRMKEVKLHKLTSISGGASFGVKRPKPGQRR
ncbi:unnamed protein product [Discula destructiva]